MYRNVEKFRGHGKFDIIVDFIFEKLVSMDHFVSVFFYLNLLNLLKENSLDLSLIHDIHTHGHSIKADNKSRSVIERYSDSRLKENSW